MTIPPVLILPGTTNTAVNPSAETDLTGWTALSGAILSPDTDHAWHGETSVKVATDGTIPIQGVTQNNTGAAVGQTWTASAYVRGDTVGNYGRILLRENGSNQPLSIESVFITAGWQRIVITRTLTDPAVTSVHIRVDNGGQPSSVQTFYVDAVQIEPGSEATPFTVGIRPDRYLPGFHRIGTDQRIGPHQVGRG